MPGRTWRRGAPPSSKLRHLNWLTSSTAAPASDWQRPGALALPCIPRAKHHRLTLGCVDHQSVLAPTSKSSFLAVAAPQVLSSGAQPNGCSQCQSRGPGGLLRAAASGHPMFNPAAARTPHCRRRRSGQLAGVAMKQAAQHNQRVRGHPNLILKLGTAPYQRHRKSPTQVHERKHSASVRSLPLTFCAS